MFFSADFVVLDMEEIDEASILLGRPFLAMSGKLIDCKKGDVTLKAETYEVIFNVFESTYSTNTSNLCFSAETSSTPCDKEHDKKKNVEEKIPTDKEVYLRLKEESTFREKPKKSISCTNSPSVGFNWNMRFWKDPQSMKRVFH